MNRTPITDVFGFLTEPHWTTAVFWLLIVAKVNAIAQEIMASPAVRESLGAQGIEPITGSPEALLAFNKAELARWAKVVQESGAKID